MNQQAQQSGVDMMSSVSASAAQCLQNAGVAFVGRYYTGIPGDSKLLTPGEAQVICAGGLTIVSLYEDDGTSFSAALGTQNANVAVQQARGVGQPADSAIYFAVDFDATADDLSGSIIPYFAAAKAAIAGLYTIGVYGSGLVCASLLGAGLASHAWLSMSTAFRGSSGFNDWSIRQLATTTLCDLFVDQDIAKPPFGGFSL